MISESAALAVYYCHWEHQIFSALQLAVVRALKELTNALTVKPQPESTYGTAHPSPPLFKASTNKPIPEKRSMGLENLQAFL